MHPSRTVSKGRRRVLLGAVVVVGAVTVSLGALVVRQVSSESADFLADTRQLLEKKVDVALQSVRLQEEAALRDLGDCVPGDGDCIRGVEDRHPLVRHFLSLEGSSLLWPPGRSEGHSLEAIPWGEPADTPLSRRLLNRAYARMAAGDTAEAIDFLTSTRGRSLPPGERAEAELALAALLARDPTRLEEAIECCDRVIELAATEAGDSGRLLGWSLTARLRKASLGLQTGSPAEALPALWSLLGDLTRDEVYFAGAGTARFYIEKVLRLFERVRGSLTREDRERLESLNRRAVRLRAEARFRKAVETQWLPAIQAAAAGGGGAVCHIPVQTESGNDVVACSPAVGEEGRILGFLVDTRALREELLAAVGVPGAVLPDIPTVESDAAGSSGSPAEVSLATVVGGGLPWTLEVPVGEELRSFRKSRYLLYGGVLAAVWILIVAAAAMTLRALSRQVELAELKSQFVANVSHELKTPLTLIRMYTDLLLLGYTERPGDRERSLSIIARETGNLGLLLDNVLDLSRIEAGEKEYQPGLEDPAPLLREVLEEYRPYLERKDFSMRLVAEEDLPAIRVDRVALAGALRNLLSNAAKYSRDRREIEVRASRVDGHLKVEVADRGVGIPPGEAARLFDRFYRGSVSEGAGTGIGLALVKHFVEAHGGRVQATNRDGGGAVFTLQFPIAPEGQRDGEEDPRGG